jgi:hypothetical protein
MDPKPGIYGYQAHGHDFKSSHIYTILMFKTYQIKCQNKLPKHLDPARFGDSLASLILVGGGTSVVLVTPSPVPNSRNQASENEDDGSVVDGFGGNGDDGGHAEERHGEERPGDSNDVGNSAKLAQVKLSSLDLLATSGETDGNGSSVRGSQANDTDTREGVEGSRGTKVDDTEDDLDNHAEHHGVERNVERSVDLGPPLGTGDGTVTSESPCASRSGSCATNTANDGENDEREEESKGTTGAANGGLDDEWHWLGGQNDFLEIGEDEHQRDDEEETGEGVDEDGGDHSLGDLDGGVLNFLAHGDNHASGRSSVGSVEETDTERPALGPSRVGLEMTKDISGITAAFLCDSEDTDDNGDNTSESPEHSSGINPGKVFVSERRDGIAQKGEAEEDEEDLVGLSRHDTDAGARLEDIDTRDNEEGGTEVNGEGNRNVSDNVEPATDPACNATPSRRGEHESLVVDASSCRIDTGDFTKRRSNTDNNERDGEPSPDNVDGAAANQRVSQGCSETVGNGSEDEGHEGDLKSRTVSRQLSLVAKVLEELIGSVWVA